MIKRRFSLTSLLKTLDPPTTEGVPIWQLTAIFRFIWATHLCLSKRELYAIALAYLCYFHTYPGFHRNDIVYKVRFALARSPGLLQIYIARNKTWVQWHRLGLIQRRYILLSFWVIDTLAVWSLDSSWRLAYLIVFKVAIIIQKEGARVLLSNLNGTKTSWYVPLWPLQSHRPVRLPRNLFTT